MPRAFTYNNGAPIEGTLQYGNLAVEASPLVFSTNPGGKKWWMGPDENGIYIIAKDVPTMNWPTNTPEGNIGSVRFWNSDETDNAFISMSNDLPARAGESNFTNITTAYSWLISNGYWTNITDSPNFQMPAKTLIKEVINPPYTESQTNIADVLIKKSGLYYNSYNNTTYIEGYFEDSQIYYTNFANLPTGDIYLTTSEGYPQNQYWVPDNEWYTDINIFWQDGPAFSNLEYQTREFENFAIDSTNNKLYAQQAADATYGYDRAVFRFNLTTKLFEESGSVIEGYQSYDPVNDKLFISNGNIPSRRVIHVMTGSDFTLPTQSLDTTDWGEPGYLTTGDTLTIAPIYSTSYTNSLRSWAIIDNSSVSISSGSIPGSNLGWLDLFYFNQVSRRSAYNPVEDKFYLWIKNQFSVPGYVVSNQTQVIVVNGSTGAYETIVPVQESANAVGGVVFSSDLVYDSNRNAVWGINTAKKLFALDCLNNTFVGEWSLFSSGDGGAWDGTLALDPSEDIIIWGRPLLSEKQAITSYDLNLFWPS